ncbi:MAG: hypothetical protein IJ708_02750 [Clostridia bacterium]|nr:hypothetical protein [Clostridia bacterium]
MKHKVLALSLATVMGVSSLFGATALADVLLEINPEAKEGIESPDTHYWYMVGDDLAAEFLSMNNNVAKLFIATQDGETVEEPVFQYKAADASDETYTEGTPRMIGDYTVRAAVGEEISENTHGYRVEAPKVMVLNDTYASVYPESFARVADYAENITYAHERTETTEAAIHYTVTASGTLKVIDAASVGQSEGTHFLPWMIKGVAKEDISVVSTEIVANGENDTKDGMDAFIRQELFKIGDMVIADPFLSGVLPVHEGSSLEVTIHYENAPDLVYTFDLTGLTLE